MPALRATLIYWPNRNGNFGHVSIRVLGTNQDGEVKTFYISWAMGNDEHWDQKLHNIKPITFELPLIERDVDEFAKKYRASPYSKTNSPTYDDPYNFLTHNCSHSVLKMLYFAGYLKTDPVLSFGLRPAAVADLGFQIAFDHYQERMNLFKHLPEPAEKCDSLIGELIAALKTCRSYKLTRLLDNSTVDIDAALAALQKLKEEPFTTEIDILEKVIKMAAPLADFHGANRVFRAFIACFPQEVIYKASLKVTISELGTQTGETINEAKAELQRHVDAEISADNIDQYRNQSIQAINKVKKELEKNSLWSKAMDFCRSLILNVRNTLAEHFSLFKKPAAPEIVNATHSLLRSKRTR